MKFTYYGHSCFLIEINGKKLLFDPFISPNPLAAHIDTSKIEADYILISHAHGDHLADAVSLANQTGAVCIANYEIYLWLQAQGLEKLHPLNQGGQVHTKFGSVKMTNAVHSSSFPDGSYGGHPAGFIVKSPGYNFYFAGDTALMPEMEYWGDTHDLNLAILPIGDNFTMGAEDAAIAATRLQVDSVIGVHYDTFPPIKIDPDEAKAVFKKEGHDLIMVGIGDSWES